MQSNLKLWAAICVSESPFSFSQTAVCCTKSHCFFYCQQCWLVRNQRGRKTRDGVGRGLWFLSIPTHSIPCFFTLVSLSFIRAHKICPSHFWFQDGFTYERAAIKAWWAGGHDTSPMTNETLSARNCYPIWSSSRCSCCWNLGHAFYNVEKLKMAWASLGGPTCKSDNLWPCTCMMLSIDL